ncbi:cysteine-rich receptor-like protein kinase 10 isoform X1 [Cinnamomum micranthum f. kanehirae]|uniref:Cysteine-rich receptor-like protein kinase 10 isoform X1 n=1 Tax=Cinnamomum micranthum f. kanehirae TaxID=337451 RepID=A0A3S3PDF0_9MAGN|nr:cysteine-rich receptor-like protein kinase 10 isoform X1 [Cinnamomum micranthum f. kanehirae]
MAPSFSPNPLVFLIFPLFLLLSTTFHTLTTADPLYQSCETTLNYTSNSTFESNLNTLLASLPSNASLNNGFYNTTTGKNQDTVYGLVLCRGDVKKSICESCLDGAIKEIKQRCPNNKIAAIWYEYCQLHYSDKRFFSLMEDATKVTLVNTVNIANPAQFLPVLNDLLSNLSTRAVNDPSLGMFATEKTKFMGSQDVYGMVQCARDLSMNDCSRCLQGAAGDVMGCCSSNRGARVLTTSCNLRFELYPFYTDSGPTSAPPVSPSTSTVSKGSISKSSQVIIAIVVPIVVIFGLFFIIVACFILRKPKKKSNDDEEISTVESLQFDLDTIKVATNNFSDENKLGQGGFGDVYRGALQNGQEIAVKRLSSASRQGVLEFKNEVQLVAKLQHRNLVRLLGCCEDGEEKILVYEYVPNTSLDNFLFDPSKKEHLTWERRYKIIGGVARGLLYLHEDSRVRIIHRDLKASNILLDSNMNPKISDFGMARLVGVDQTQGRTNIIAGTYGYMAPEYAMNGQFSVKSDVFSFGVLLLEIISGQKNNYFNQSDGATGLLSYAWRLWKEGTPMEIMDPTLGGTFSRNEVMRCIHIGLLCVQEDVSERPIMSSIVLMLNSFSVTLPRSSPPPFFLRGRKEFSRNAILSDPRVSETEKSACNSMPMSVNEVTITEIDPR